MHRCLVGLARTVASESKVPAPPPGQVLGWTEAASTQPERMPGGPSRSGGILGASLARRWKHQRTNSGTSRRHLRHLRRRSASREVRSGAQGASLRRMHRIL